MESAKAVLEVVAGVIPERPEQELTRRWVITSKQWEDAPDKAALLAEANGRGLGYAALLMLQPDRLNWVRADWLWL